MSSKRVLSVAIAFGLAAIAIPLGATVYLSWRTALSDEQERLGRIADQAIGRTEFTFSQASAALAAISAAPYEPCTSKHIAEMQRLIMNTQSINEIGYFERGKLRCTSWGPTTFDVRQAAPDFQTASGLSVTAAIKPAVSGSNKMMALQRGAYNALVDPIRMVDVIADNSIEVAVAHRDGWLLGSRGGSSESLFNQTRSSPTLLDDSRIRVYRNSGEWRAAAAEPFAVAREVSQHQLRLLLPFGIATAAAMVSIVVYFSRKRLSPAGELAMAVHKREFVVHYQPIMELKTGICVGVEALVRWRRPDGTMVPPDQFIPLAEETGLILPITDQVIHNAIADLKPKLVENRDLHVAINLAAADMKTGRVLIVLQKALAGTDIRPSQIWLEATERGFMSPDMALAMINQARELGYSIAIDDFGTGYSSLQYLATFPLDALKIDKSFVKTIGRDTATSSVTLHIIEMAKALDLQIIAEGIETAKQLEYLLANDVAYGQGWLFSRPLPIGDLPAFLAKSKQRTGVALRLVRSVA